MSSDEDIANAANSTIDNLIPNKSRLRYEWEYQKFEDWCLKKNVKSITENLMLAYFSEKAGTEKPSSLWTHYSMVRSVLFLKKNVDISKYMQLYAFLKRKSEGYRPKKSSVFSKEEIDRFLVEADDNSYLMMKVVLIIGIFGACRREELINLRLDDIEDKKKCMTVTLSKTKPNAVRQFLITKGKIPGVDCLQNFRKYLNLRPPTTTHDRLFVFYKNGKCTSQPVGINTFGRIPKMIATYLGLKNPGSYTGHCFRRSSAPLLADVGADIQTVKRHGGWKSSSIAEGLSTETQDNNCRTSASTCFHDAVLERKCSFTTRESTPVIERTSALHAGILQQTELTTAIPEQNNAHASISHENIPKRHVHCTCIPDFETEESRHHSTPQLQRLLLIEQLKLTRLQTAFYQKRMETLLQ